MMRKRQDKIQWGRVLRRSAALFMATLALWALLMSGGSGSAADIIKSLGENPDFISTLLRAELGDAPPATGPLALLDRWGRLAVEQSALLRSNEGAVAARLSAAGEGGEPNLPAGDGHAAEDEADDIHTEDSDPDDPQNLPAATAAPDDIVPRTIVPTTKEGYAYADGVYILNRTKLSVDAAALAAAPVQIALEDTEAPQILIMHTHATEAYTPDGADLYEATDNSRTLDSGQNMVRVGAEMAEVFEEMGIKVIHDESAYDYPQYSGAYGRSGAGVAEYLAKYPSIKIVLDVHRDALIGEDGTVYKTLTSIDGKPTAQVMLVLGSPEGGDYPNWLENLTLAMRVQKSMNTLYPTLARPITIRSPVYNQSLTNGSLLVEVGCHGNTLQEAIHGARLFARAAGQVLLGLSPAK